MTGQLGSAILFFSKYYENYNFVFTNKNTLDISDNSNLILFFKKNKIDVVINTAAYTNVSECEKNGEYADKINNKSVGYLARICKEYSISLIHLSTDYVFDGEKNQKYHEYDKTNPLNQYGISKLKGENQIINLGLKNAIIIRTSWLYSRSKNNFVSKIINSLEQQNQVDVVNTEIGSPTNAEDLAETILNIIPNIDNENPEIYHYCNSGFCSRYEFAYYIANFIDNFKINPVEKYGNVERPKFSSLSTAKIKREFEIKTYNWKVSLKKHLQSIHKKHEF